MFWFIPLIAAAASAYGANQNSKAAGKASDAQERMAAADLAFRREQYDRYLGLFGPAEEQLAAEARSGMPLGYDKLKAQIETNYGNTSRDLAAAMSGRGMAGSGQDMAGMRGLAMAKAGALTSAYGQGLDARRNLALTLTGRNQIGSAAQGVMGGMQNMSNLYGQQANLYNQGAAAGWQNFAQSLGELGRSYGSQETGTEDIAPDYSVPSVEAKTFFPTENLSPIQPTPMRDLGSMLPTEFNPYEDQSIYG